MRPVSGNYLHWHGNGWHAGFMRHGGNCWKFRFGKSEYHTCTFYHFWRFFISIDK